MAQLTDAIVLKRTAKPTFAMRINNVPLLPQDANDADGVPGIDMEQGWQTSVSKEAPIAVAQIVVNRLPDWIDRGHSVTIDAGYDGINERVFTGYVKARGEEDPDFARSRITVLGADTPTGRLTSTATLVGGGNLFKPAPPAGWYSDEQPNNPLADTQAKCDEMALRKLARRARVPRRPAGDINRRTIWCTSQLDKAQRTIEMATRSLDLLTGKAAAENILDYVGITARQIESVFTSFTLGTNSTAQLGRMSALQMLMYIAELFGATAAPLTGEGTVFDTDDGITVMRVIDEIAPSATAFRTLSTETQAQAYIIDNTSELVIPCDPRIKLFFTLGLVMPRLGLNGRFVVNGRTISFSNRGFLNALDMRGGDEVGGTVGLDPQASLAYQVTFQNVGNVLQAIVSFRAQSTDGDGTIVEASRVWADTHATNPEITTFNGRASGQVRLAANTAGYAITLTETDDSGRTNAVTVPIDLAPTTQGYEQPGVFTAQDVGAGASADGGVTFSDQADATCKSVGALPPDGVHSGEAVFGMTNGRIEKTSDWCRTALTQVLAADAANGEVNDLWPDLNVNGRMWAGFSLGRLYKAPDRGVTWALHKDLGGTYPVNRIATPVAAAVGEPESVWAFGGRADQTSTLIQYDRGLTGTFVSPVIAGELLTDLSGASSAISVAAAASRQAGELLIAFKGGLLASVNLFYTNDIHGDGTAWKRATGLDAGLSEWRWISPSSRPGIFYGQTASVRHIWKIDCTSGTPVCTKLSDRLPNLAGITANHGLWEGEFLGGVNDVYLISVETTAKTEGLYKWVAEETTAGALRDSTHAQPCPANFKGRMSAIGPPSRGTTQAGRVAVTENGANPDRITKLLDTAVWDALVNVTGVNATPRPFWLKPNVCLVTNDTGTPAYSKDGGATFAALPAALDRLVWAACDAGGRLWALCEGTAAARTDIYYSDDDGVSWNVSVEEITSRTAGMIACHPTMSNIIAIVGTATFGNPGWVYITQNRGTSWTEYIGGGRPRCAIGPTPSTPQRSGFAFFTNGRMIVSGPGCVAGIGGDDGIMTSDDLGATWITRRDETGANKTHFGLGVNPFTGKAVVWYQDFDPSPNLGYPLVSLDFGNTWAIGAPSQTYQVFTGTDSDGVSAMVYDYEDDVCYLGRQSGSSTKRVAKFSPVSDAGLFVDIQGNIGSTTFGLANLTVIPRA